MNEINKRLAINLKLVECWHEYKEAWRWGIGPKEWSFDKDYAMAQRPTCSTGKKPWRGADRCVKCKVPKNVGGNNFNAFCAGGFFQLLNEAKKQEWWEEFISRYGIKLPVKQFREASETYLGLFIEIHLIDFKTFPLRLDEFGRETLGWR